MRILIFLISVAAVFAGCGEDKPAPPPRQLTREEMIPVNIDSLKRTAQACDLLVRQGDDLISAQIRFLNETDKQYSHAGLIVEKDGKKYVCHIAPGIPPADTIQYTSIDSFLNPTYNATCALYRFNMSPAERDEVMKIIDKYKATDVRFDRVYNIKSTDKMYCTEMIYRAFKQATNNRIDPRLADIPKRMFKVLLKYFEKEKASTALLSKMKIVTVDNLYLSPHASLVMAFPLKYYPGQ
jgi:hypothetical protein